MSERVSLGAAGQRLGVSGGDIGQAGYAKVTAGRLEARETRAAGMARPGPGSQTPAGAAPGWGLVLRLRRCAGGAAQPGGGLHAPRVRLVQQERETIEFPSRPGMIVVRTFNVAGYFDGYVHRIAAAGERASVHRAAGLARAAFLNAPGEPES